MTQWASKKQFVDRFRISILLKINCGLRYDDLIKRYVFLMDSCSTGYGIPDQKAAGDCSCNKLLTVVL